MRTTVTLDDDVAVLLRQKMSRDRVTFREALNQTLRQGLGETRPRPSRERYETPQAELGRCLIGNLDDIADVLAIAEGEEYR